MNASPITAAFITLLVSLAQRETPQQASRVPRVQTNTVVNLYDAFGRGKRGTILDWGFSALLYYDGKTILFDGGSDDAILERNVRALGIDLRKVDFAVLSHRHGDHANGFDYLLRVNPSVKLYLPDDRALGAPETWEFPGPRGEVASLPPEQLYWRGEGKAVLYRPSGRFARASAEFPSASREVAPGVLLIATRSMLMGDFTRYPPNEAQPELTGLPELSLALKTPDGIVLIVGCAHSGVDKIVEEAKRQLKTRVHLVMGGFHLLPYSAEEIRRLGLRLKNELGVRRLAPAHCSGALAFKVFRELYGADYVYAGLEAEIPF